MIATSFLKKETETSKGFSLEEPKYLKLEKFSDARIRFTRDIYNRNGLIACRNFFFRDGSVYLPKANEFYTLVDHVQHNTDIILPKDINLTDWIVLFYEQGTTIDCVSHEKKTPIKIRGNGNRIMGLDEPLICDMAFMTLRLTFLGDIEGWVVT